MIWKVLSRYMLVQCDEVTRQRIVCIYEAVDKRESEDRQATFCSSEILILWVDSSYNIDFFLHVFFLFSKHFTSVTIHNASPCCGFSRPGTRPALLESKVTEGIAIRETVWPRRRLVGSGMREGNGTTAGAGVLVSKGGGFGSSRCNSLSSPL